MWSWRSCWRRESRRVTVVTNMVQVMEGAVHALQGGLIFIGGVLNREKQNGFVGSLAVDFLPACVLDAGFFGTVGVDVYDNAVFHLHAGGMAQPAGGGAAEPAVLSAGGKREIQRRRQFSICGLR